MPRPYLDSDLALYELLTAHGEPLAASIEQLANAAGLDTRTARRAAVRLEEHGWIRRIRDRHQRVYTFEVVS